MEAAPTAFMYNELGTGGQPAQGLLPSGASLTGGSPPLLGRGAGAWSLVGLRLPSVLTHEREAERVGCEVDGRSLGTSAAGAAGFDHRRPLRSR